MINLKDLHTYYVPEDLTTIVGNVSKKIGTSIAKYEVRPHRDIRNLKDKRAYQVLCTHRIIIPSTISYTPFTEDTKGKAILPSYNNYPGMIKNRIGLSWSPSEQDAKSQADTKRKAAAGGSIELVKYAPRTLNASVTTTHSGGAGASTSVMHQHTSGSSTSQSNSYGASVSVGFMGDVPTGGVSADYSHTQTNEHSHSATAGGSTSSSGEHSSGATMSIKDWGCDTTFYNASTESYTPEKPTWIWTQEYPWNIAQFYDQATTKDIFTLPQYIQSQLRQGDTLLPPSQLSLYGIDFTMQCMWIVCPADGDEDIYFNHDVEYYTATHGIGSKLGEVTASVTAVPVTLKLANSATTPPPGINLSDYAIGPIVPNGPRSAGVVGFVPHKFVTLPTLGTASKPPTFEFISSADSLKIEDTTGSSAARKILLDPDATQAKKKDAITEIQPLIGAGFKASPTALTACFTEDCKKLQMKIDFKIADTTADYTLFMKHWKLTHAEEKDKNGNVIKPGIDSNLKLTIRINGAPEIVEHVTDREGEGGEHNLSAIALRNLDYASIDYHDYLKLGLNTITIDIEPYTEQKGDRKLQASLPAGDLYQIRALSIERS